MRPITREAIVERRQRQVPMRWSAVFAGAMLTLGCWLFLQFLGSGVAMMSFQPRDLSGASGFGLFTGGWWFVVSAVVAAFVGGLLAGGLELTRGNGHGALYGLVSWALSTVFGMLAVFAFTAFIASSVVRLGSAAVRATGEVAGQVASGASTRPIASAATSLGIDMQDLVAPINQRLQAQHMPPITAQQLEQTIRTVARRGLQQGHLDRQTFVTAIANETSLSRADAQQVVNQIAARADQLAEQVQGLKQRAQAAVASTVRGAGEVVLWIGITLVLALITSMIGGALGAAWRQRAETGPPRDPGDVAVAPTAEPEHHATIAPAT